jgi:hypothetical protein
MRIRILALVFGITLAFPAFVSAQTRAALIGMKGADSKKLGAAIESVLEDHDIELVSPHRVSVMAKRSGADLDSESGRVRVAKRLKLRAFIQGRTSVAKKRVQVSVVVFGGGDGSPAAEYNVVVAKAAIAKDVQAHLWAAIGGAFTGSGAAAPDNNAVEPELVEETGATKPTKPTRPTKSPPRRVAESEPVDTEKPEGQEHAANEEGQQLAEQADQEEPSTGHGPSPLDVSIGARLGNRSFAYNDSLPGLRGYSLGVGPSVALRAHWYPAAHFGSGALANIGLDLRGELMVGVSSENSMKQKFTTSSHELGVGVRGRLPLGKLELGLVAGFGQHSFGLSNSDKIDPDIPDVVYNFVRLGPDARWQFASAWAVQLGAAYLIGLSQGQIAASEWFPHTSGNGLELELGLQFAVSRVLGFELNFGLQRYFMSLNPDPKDPGVVGASPRVAGGALDEYFSTRFGVIIRL